VWNILQQDTEICSSRSRQNESKEFFSEQNYLIFCNDFWSIIGAVGHQQDPTERRLFIDTSKVTLKAVLLHNGNKSPSVPLADVANIKESYENKKLLLGKIRVKNVIGIFVWV
jgi:G:T/U-mismatch repair DNA glycosylase